MNFLIWTVKQSKHLVFSIHSLLFTFSAFWNWHWFWFWWWWWVVLNEWNFSPFWWQVQFEFEWWWWSLWLWWLCVYVTKRSAIANQKQPIEIFSLLLVRVLALQPVQLESVDLHRLEWVDHLGQERQLH